MAKEFNTTFNNIPAISWGQLYLSKQSKYQKKTIDLPQVTDKLYHIILYRAYLAMRVIGTRIFSGDRH